MKYILTYKQFETQIQPSEEDIFQHALTKQIELLNRDLTPEEFEILRKQVQNSRKGENEIPKVNYLGQNTKGYGGSAGIRKNPIGSTVSNTG